MKKLISGFTAFSFLAAGLSFATIANAQTNNPRGNPQASDCMPMQHSHTNGKMHHSKSSAKAKSDCAMQPIPESVPLTPDVPPDELQKPSDEQVPDNVTPENVAPDTITPPQDDAPQIETPVTPDTEQPADSQDSAPPEPQITNN